MAVQYIEVVTCDWPECPATAQDGEGMAKYDFGIGRSSGRRRHLVRVHLCQEHGDGAEALFAHLARVGEKVAADRGAA